jgi:hypothetical protein
MPIFPDAVLVNVNPSFGRFAQPLVNLIAQKTAIAEWQYCLVVQKTPERLAVQGV